MLFILTVYSYSFLPFLYNFSHRLTELNVSYKTDFVQKYLMKTTTSKSAEKQNGLEVYYFHFLFN